MWLISAEVVGPKNLKKRISVNEIKSYADLYDFIQENCLVNSNIPASFARAWEKAHADSFSLFNYNFNPKNLFLR